MWVGKPFLNKNENILKIIASLFGRCKYMLYIYNIIITQKDMTTITAKLTGNTKDLEMVLTCGIRFNSTKQLGQHNLIVTWICEETNYNKALEECMDLVSLREVELWNCNLEYIA